MADARVATTKLDIIAACEHAEGGRRALERIGRYNERPTRP
jgi:hypothetical protein